MMFTCVCLQLWRDLVEGGHVSNEEFWATVPFDAELMARIAAQQVC